MKNGVFWDVKPCGSCKNRRFGGTTKLQLATDVRCEEIISSFRATFPPHIILLDLIILFILSKEFKLLMCSVCSFLHPPVTSDTILPRISFLCAIVFVHGVS
jgi:hypothetical protein